MQPDNSPLDPHPQLQHDPNARSNTPIGRDDNGRQAEAQAAPHAATTHALYTVEVARPRRGCRPHASHCALTMEQAHDLAHIYRLLGYEPSQVGIHPQTEAADRRLEGSRDDNCR